MLKVNNIEAKIKTTEFKFSKYTYDGLPHGYCGFIQVTFEVNDNNGYFDFYIDNIMDQEITYYINKEYYCVPEDNHQEINYLEIFDTDTFYDIGCFYNKMKVKFGDINNNKIKMNLIIDEEVVSLYFDDYVDICI